MPAWMWWVIIGLALLVAEIPNQSFYLMWFGIGALLAAATSLAAGLPLQLVVFFGSSVALLLVMRPITYRFIYANTPHFDTNVDRMSGRLADVIETVDNLSGTGGVRLFGADYNALSSADGVIIGVGRKVRVVKVIGAKLVVEPVEGIHPEAPKEG